MANNVTLSAGTADGAVVATDDITSVHYPYAKVGIGADDTFTILVGGNGAAAAGVLRVTLASDSTGNIATIGTSVTPGTAAANLGKAEDAAHSSGDTGVMLLAVREAANADLSAGATDGDYEPLQVDATGRLWVHAGLVDTVTTVTTVSALGVSTTGPMKKEDVASADGDAGIAVFAIRDDTLDARSGTEGDYEPFHTDANGALWVDFVNTNIATIGTSVTPGTAAGNLGKAEDAAHSSGDTGVMLLAVRESTATDLSAGNTNGDYEPLQVDASGQLWVNVGSFTPGTAAGSLGKAEDAAHSSGDTGVMMLAVRAAAPTERSAGPTDGDYEPLGVNEVGAVWASLTGSANGGLSTFMASGSDGSSILVATAQAIKASAGTLYGYYVYNPEAAVTFVHFYNTAQASVTVGTTNPLFTLAVPAGAAANLYSPQGIAFSNAGWSCAATTTAGGNTAPSTGASLVAWYK